MYAACADAYFCSETVPESVGESGGGVDECPRGVDSASEVGGGEGGFGYDDVGVVGGVGVDVGDCCGEGRDG